MASNFRISTHQNSDNLHLKLVGDFDGSSACELLRSVKKGSRNFRRIFIHTNSLEKIYPFGRDIFLRDLLDLKGRSIHLLFTGEKWDQIAPQESLPL